MGRIEIEGLVGGCWFFRVRIGYTFSMALTSGIVSGGHFVQIYSLRVSIYCNRTNTFHLSHIASCPTDAYTHL